MNIDLGAFGNLLYPFYDEHCGQTVASVQETLTVETADADVAATLGIRAGKPIVVISRLAFDLGRHTLEWRRSRGRADRFCYEIEIR
jgi:GntR family transcriptional regulator